MGKEPWRQAVAGAPFATFAARGGPFGLIRPATYVWIRGRCADRLAERLMDLRLVTT